MRSLTAIATLLLLTGCSGKKESSEPPSSFSAFVDLYFDSYFRFYPSQGTAAGLHEYDRRIESRKEREIEARIKELKSEAQQLDNLRKRTLSADDKIDATLIANQIQAELLDLDTIQVWRSPLYYAGMAGNAVDLLMKREFAPAAERLSLLTERLRNAPLLIKQMTDNTRNPALEFTELATRIVRGSIPFFRDDVAKWAKTAAGGNDRLLAEFSDANRKVVTALEAAAKGLEDDIRPYSSGRYAIGADSFSRKLRYEEMVDLPLDDLLRIGQERLERDHKAFLELAKVVAPGRSPTEAVSVLAADHPNADNLMGFATNTLENVRSYVTDHKIVPIPSEQRARVMPTPPYARSGTFASMDTPGPYEKNAAEAFYYVTPVEPEWTAQHKLEHVRLFNLPVMDMITVHEAYPGHYVQFLYAKQFPTKTRKLISCGTNAEGWAHYAEQMMVEEGFGGGDPKIRLAQLSEALVRDARYVAGIKMHTAGWSVEDATKLFTEQAFMERSTAMEEARRGTWNPTYLYYTLGKLEIYKLRSDYQRLKGSGYSLASFHEQFVKQGAIPIPLIREILLPGDKSPLL